MVYNQKRKKKSRANHSMRDFIIIALLGFLILATYIQYKELRDLRIALVSKKAEAPPPMASDEVFVKKA